jgi:hypothetical protein
MLERGGIAERSLDMVKASKFLHVNNAVGPREVFASRHELLQNEYKKVIECHPSTFVNPTDNYDDTEFLNRMFSNDKEIIRFNNLHHIAKQIHDSSDQSQTLTLPITLP